MTTCKRNFSREQIEAGLKAGHVLVLDRRDAPELADLLEMEKQGLVKREFVEVDEQYSVIKWRWNSA